MKKLSKNYKKALEKIDKNKEYSLLEAINLVKEITFTKFDASVDLVIQLGVDPRKANQVVRGVVVLPHGTGKKIRVLALCSPDKEKEAIEAGAEYVGLDEYIEKIKNGWLDFEAVVATPNVMPKIGALGKILGPRGLMPNPKTGTVTQDIAKAIKDLKSGKIEFKTDKYGIVHSSIGKVSFPSEHLYENATELLSAIIKAKPTTTKGTYLKSIYLSSTMSPSIKVSTKSITNI